MNKSSRPLLWIAAILVLTFGSTIGFNNFIPSSFSMEIGGCLTMVVVLAVVAMLLRQMLRENTPIVSMVSGLVLITFIVGWRMAVLLIVSIPDVYTRNFGVEATLPIHPTKIIEGSRAPYQAEITEVPPLINDLFLTDAPAPIKRFYHTRGPVHEIIPITLTGLRSVFGFHKTGYSQLSDFP